MYFGMSVDAMDTLATGVAPERGQSCGRFEQQLVVNVVPPVVVNQKQGVARLGPDLLDSPSAPNVLSVEDVDPLPDLDIGESG